MTIYSQLSLLQSCRNFINFSGWHRRQHQVRQLVFGQSLLVKRNCMNCAWCGMCASKCLIKLSANYAEMSPSCRGRKTSCCWRPKWLIGRLHNCDVIAARVQMMFISNETESVGEREKKNWFTIHANWYSRIYFHITSGSCTAGASIKRPPPTPHYANGRSSSNIHVYKFIWIHIWNPCARMLSSHETFMI